MFLKCHLLHLHLAGFVSTERESQEQIDQLKRDVIQMIKSLGGDYVDTDVWDDSVTHVIAKLDPEKEGFVFCTRNGTYIRGSEPEGPRGVRMASTRCGRVERI